MAKDPAFLFYSNDFYEGTRMMLPEERACYIDLLIYQHQRGIIPNDIKRLVMYCSGCSEDVVNRVLNQKFNQTDNGWLNKRLIKEQAERSEFKPKRIASATFAGLISSNNLTKVQIKKLKSAFKIENFIYEDGSKINDFEEIKIKIKKWFTDMLNQMVKNIEDEDRDENKDKDKDINKKGGVGGKQNHFITFPFPTESFCSAWEQWKEYRRVQHGFEYISQHTEQAALHELVIISDSTEANCIAVIQQSMANGWKQFFKLKEEDFKNGKQSVTGTTGGLNADYKRELAERMAANTDKV